MRGQQIAVFFPGQGVLDTTAFRTYQAASPDLDVMLSDVDDISRDFWRTPVTEALTRRGHADGSLDLLIFVASLAAYKQLLRQGVRPYTLLGHGFGEIAALVAADALSLADGAHTVARRFMALASSKTRSAMASVQVSPTKLRAFLRILNERAISVAVENSSTESVIVGPAAAISAAGELARMLGLPFRRLKATFGPHHTSMNGIKEELLRSLRHIAPRPPKVPVFSPLRGRSYREDDDVLDCVAEQLVQPLRFADAVRLLVADGVTLFIECGPLRGLAAQLDSIAVADTAFHHGLLDKREHGAAVRMGSPSRELEVA